MIHAILVLKFSIDKKLEIYLAKIYQKYIEKYLNSNIKKKGV